MILCQATGRPHLTPQLQGTQGGAQTGRLQLPVHCSGASLENRMKSKRWTQAWTPVLSNMTQESSTKPLGWMSGNRPHFIDVETEVQNGRGTWQRFPTNRQRSQQSSGHLTGQRNKKHRLGFPRLPRPIRLKESRSKRQ